MNPTEPLANHSDRILTELLRLRAANALPLERVANAKGVLRFRFRCGGWPIVIDLDDTVLALRAYYGNHTLASGRVPQAALRRLVAEAPPAGTADADGVAAAFAGLRGVVADWKRLNPRVFMEPPSVARHPDGWNNS